MLIILQYVRFICFFYYFKLPNLSQSSLFFSFSNITTIHYPILFCHHFMPYMFWILCSTIVPPNYESQSDRDLTRAWDCLPGSRPRARPWTLREPHALVALAAPDPPLLLIWSVVTDSCAWYCVVWGVLILPHGFEKGLCNWDSRLNL